jgi:hypothetical protein
MTKRTMRIWFIWAIIAFLVLLFIGVLISIFDCSNNRVVFTTFKDLMPLFLGIAAVWLSYCVQRRNAYQQQLRSLWSTLINAVHFAIQYSYLNNPTSEQYRTVLIKLSVAIDEVRGVFCNLGELESDKGLYPFEPIKDMHHLIECLGFGDSFKPCDAEKCREQIFALWKDVRKEILKEFDREVPTFPHSHWANLSKGRVYDEHQIPKTPT